MKTINYKIIGNVKFYAIFSVISFCPFLLDSKDKMDIFSVSPEMRKAKEILLILKKGNYAALEKYADPKKGIFVSPYIGCHSGLKLLRKDLKTTDRKKVWGSYDGTGDPILLTMDEYFKRFVYAVDYLEKTDEIFINRIRGNAVSSMEDVFPESTFIEFYYKGSNDPFIGWRSLILVLKKRGKVIYLIGIINDEWEI
ncbi:MAG TPA: hypothetical protein PKV80_28815 [Leptospiraceae bacterium]|nr:hypothetical protein [Leptospiraceae bacterium]